jgi:hypothetical protein
MASFPPRIRVPARSSGLLLRRAFVALFLLVVLVFAVWRTRLYFRVNARIAAIRDAGLPVSPAEINTWLPAVSDAQNGALILTQAFTQLHEFAENRSNTLSDLVLKHGESWSPEQRVLAQAYVVTNQEAISQIEHGLQFPAYRFPVDYSFGANTLLPHLAKIKQSAQILRFQTILQAEEKIPAWTNSVLLQLKLAEMLNSEPTVIAYLVRIAILRIASQSAEYALNRSAPDPAACKIVAAAFLRASQTNTFPQALIAERAMFLPYFRLSYAEMNTLSRDDGVDGEKSPPTPIKPSGKAFRPLWVTGFFERDLDFYLATMEKAIGISRSRAPANLDLTNIFDVSGIIRRRLLVMSGMLLPALSKTAVKGASGEAATKLAATAFAIESYRATHHQLPENLNALTPEFLAETPRDPFDANPIRYRRLPRGYLLYSIDADGHDDGGEEPPPKKKFKDPNTYDLTFTVKR